MRVGESGLCRRSGGRSAGHTRGKVGDAFLARGAVDGLHEGE